MIIRRKNRRFLYDPETFDWSKYNITSDVRSKKKVEVREKSRTRVKDLSKGTGFVKDEHKFSTGSENKDFDFLDSEETNNLQDMINFAASRASNTNNESNYPFESLYSQVLRDSSKGNQNITNERIDNEIAGLLQRKFYDENDQIRQILDSFKQLLKMKNKNLSSSTYIGMIELFLRNGYLNYASYFLCQMDRLKYQIPRKLLDQFVDYSVNKKLFEKEIDLEGKGNENKLFNKFDKFDPKSDPDLEYYLKRRQHYRERNDIVQIFSKLNINANPFISKRYNNQHSTGSTGKTALKDIDAEKVKEYVPKNYNKKENTHNN